MIEKIAEATIDLNIVEGGEGGSSIVYQSTTPPASDYQSGDTWFKTDANDNVVEVYAHDGSTWDKKEYTSGALDMEDVQDSMIRFGESSGTHLVINNGAVEFHTNETTFPVSVNSDGVDLGSEATVSIKTGGVEDTTLSAGGLSVVGREPTLNISAVGSVGESTINLEADNVLVNGEPIGGGGSGGFLPAVSLGRKNNDTGTQSIGTSITKIDLGTDTTVNTDTKGEYFQITSGQVKCLKSGVVVVSASVYLSHSSTSGYETLFLFKNGVETMSDRRYSTGITTTLNLTTMMTVNAGDYFDIRGVANASSTFYKYNRATTLDVMYLNLEPIIN